MDELHPLFRNDVPSTSELRSNDFYSALVEISTQKAQDISTDNRKSHSIKSEKNSSKASTVLKGISKTHNSEKHVKGRYQRHLNKIKATKSRIEHEKKQEASKNIITESHSVNDDYQEQEKKQFAEVELCMSIWSSKNTFLES